MTKSRAEELNPVHNCSKCGVEHFFIPPLQMNVRNPEGQIIQVPLMPIEISVVGDGYTSFTCDDEPSHEASVPVVGMLWGVPGSTKPCAKSMIVLN